MTRRISRIPMREVSTALERIHMDICGPFRTKSWHGNIYMLTIIDQYTKFKWGFFRNSKKNIAGCLEKWCQRAENDRKINGNNEKLQAIRFDRGTEFLNQDMKNWAYKNNIGLEPTVGYRPEANGIAERANRTIMEKGNSMRFRAKLSAEYWELSFRAAIYLINRQPIGERNTTPWTEWYGEVPEVDHYKVWGCMAYVHIPKEKRGKLDKRCWKGIFAGYSIGMEDCERQLTKTTKIYYIWHQKDKKLYEAQSVEFDERIFSVNDSPLTSTDQNQLAEVASDGDESSDELINSRPIRNIDTQHNDATDHNNQEPNIESESLSSNSQPPQSNLHLNTSQSITQEGILPENQSHLISREPENLPHSHPDPSQIAVQRKESHNDYLKRKEEEAISRGDRRSVRTRKPTENAAEMLTYKQRSCAAIELAFSAARDDQINVPVSFEAALQTPQANHWVEAYESEMASLAEHGTLSGPLNNIPANKSAVTAKIVLALKRGEDNKIIRYKARLVARGFTQKHGVDFEETFAPTIRLDALRIILAIAAKEKWKIYQMDVVTAFLAGDLNDEVYIKMPGHMIPRFGRYARIIKSLYGLKQAARVWYLLFAEFVTSVGFSCLPTDQTIFINNTTKAIIGIHVDDLLITGSNNMELQRLKQQLESRFKMKDLGIARYILGIRITRNLNELMIDQSQYAKSIVKDFSMSGTKIYATPMASDAVGELERTPGKPCTDEELANYWKLLGKLMYLCNTRPDIIFQTHKMAQYSHKACYNHWLALLRILSYVEGTINYGIRYGGEGDEIPYYKVDHNIEVYCGSSRSADLVTFADADYAGDHSDRKSISGIIMMLNGGAVAAISKKQTSVATSTTNAEYIAASEAAKLAIWGGNLLSQITQRTQNPIPLLLGDNKACIQLQSGVSNTSKIKHVDVAYHHIVDEVNKGKLESRWISGDQMLADGLTKPLPRPAFESKRVSIGVVDISEADQQR
ncbi:hypothetical protein K3495_g7973 [Podosphaera aphanis]|nr:hypothetical protein K3495_g7973 [Podosphaera aphanis]